MFRAGFWSRSLTCISWSDATAGRRCFCMGQSGDPLCILQDFSMESLCLLVRILPCLSSKPCKFRDVTLFMIFFFFFFFFFFRPGLERVWILAFPSFSSFSIMFIIFKIVFFYRVHHFLSVSSFLYNLHHICIISSTLYGCTVIIIFIIFQHFHHLLDFYLLSVGCLGFWLLGFLASWLSGFLAFWILGFLALWLFRFLALWFLAFCTFLK